MEQNVWKARNVLVSLTTTTTTTVFILITVFIFINLFGTCESNSFLQVENKRSIPTDSLINFSPQLLDQPKLPTAGNTEDASHDGLKSKHRRKSKHRNKTGHHKRKHHKKKKNKTRHGSRNTDHPYVLVPSTTPKAAIPAVVQNAALDSLNTLNLQDLVPKTANNEFSFPILNNPVEIVKPNIVQKPEEHEPAVKSQAPEVKQAEKKQEEPLAQNQQQQQQKEQQQQEQKQEKETKQQQKEQPQNEKPQEKKQQEKQQEQNQLNEKKQQKEKKQEKEQQQNEKKQQKEKKEQQKEKKEQQKEKKEEHQTDKKQQKEQQKKVKQQGKEQQQQKEHKEQKEEQQKEPKLTNDQMAEPKREEFFQRKSEVKPESNPEPVPVPVETQKVEVKTPSRPEFWVRSDINVEDSEPENLLELNEEKRALKKKKIKKASKLGRGRKAGKKAGKAAAGAEGASSEAPPVPTASEPPVDATGKPTAPPGGGVSGAPSEPPPGVSGVPSEPPPGVSSYPTSAPLGVSGGSPGTPPTGVSGGTVVPWIDFPSEDGNGTGNGSRLGYDPNAALPTQEEYDQKCKTAENMENKARCLPSQNQITPDPVDPNAKSKNPDIEEILNWYGKEGKRLAGNFEDKPTYSVERQNRKLVITSIRNALDPLPDTELEPLNGFKLLNTTKWIFESICPVNLVPPQFLDMVVVAFKRMYEQTTRDRRPFLNDVEYGWIDNMLRTCVETAVPANYLQDSCKEEVYAVDANGNLLCLGFMTNRNHNLQSTACFQTDLRTFDPVLDVIWLMFEAVKATCFQSFQGNSRLLHRYSAAIMDLFTRPLKFRWPFESGGIKFWERILGPGVELYLRNIDKCLQHIIQHATLDFRTQRFFNTHTVRLSNTLTDFIDLP